MTYEEIVERVRKKSSICPECGCFISSLLDCCPACGYSTATSASTSRLNDSYCSADEFSTSLQRLNVMRDHYKSMGGNGATDSLMDKMARPYITRASYADLLDTELSPGTIMYTYDTNDLYTCNLNGVVQKIATNYINDNYTDYTSYYKAKNDALQAQQRTMRLYEDAIKAMKSYSGNKVAIDIIEEEIERVKDYYL